MNNILIYFETFEKHVKYVKKILNCFIKKELRLKFEKCEFHKQKIKFLKFLINNKKIKIDLKKIKTIENWKSSKNVKKIQTFIDFVNYNRKFIKNYLKKNDIFN